MALLTQFLVTLFALLSLTHAHNILLQSHSQECFHETLHHDDKMTVTFQVGDRDDGGSGDLHIDFWVRQGRGIMPAAHLQELMGCLLLLNCMLLHDY